MLPESGGKFPLRAAKHHDFPDNPFPLSPMGEEMSEANATTDWAAWSREAVETMIERNQQWPAQFGLSATPQCRWDLERALLVLEAPLHQVVATVCLVGTTSEQDNSFAWSWANPAIPAQHGQALEVVHEFGRSHGLALLTTGNIPGGRPVANECLSIAARLQHALGTFIDQQGDMTLYFSILHLQVAPNNDLLTQ